MKCPPDCSGAIGIRAEFLLALRRAVPFASPSAIICAMNRRLIFGLALVLGLAKPLSAQTPDLISVDLSVGPSNGSGTRENYYLPGTAAAEFTIAIGPIHSTGRIFALTVGGNLSYSATDICAIDETRTDRCLPIFPSTTHIGLLGGYHIGRSHTSLRAMIGPIAFAGGGPSGAGGLLQVDGTAGLSHVAFLVGLRGQVLRRINGETLYIRSLGLGLRLQ